MKNNIITLYELYKQGYRIPNGWIHGVKYTCDCFACKEIEYGRCYIIKDEYLIEMNNHTISTNRIALCPDCIHKFGEIEKLYQQLREDKLNRILDVGN